MSAGIPPDVSSVGLPNEMQLGNLDFSLPPDAKSMSIKVQPSNIQNISTTFVVPTGATNSNIQEISFPSQNLIFDLPCGSSPSMFLDSRFTTLNFSLTVSTPTQAGAAGTYSDSYLRSGAHAFFDRMYITSQNGAIVEDILEYGLVNDTLIALQMNNAVRHGVATQYGFDYSSSTLLGSQGHKIGMLSSGAALSTSNIETHSYSIPLTSALIGVLADKFCNVGRTAKLQLVLQTSNVLPITVSTGTSFSTSPNVNVTLSNFSLQCEYVDIGLSALKMLDASLIDNKAYIHGVTYRTTSTSMPATQGSVSLLAGLRASSVKSLFCRFAQSGTLSTTNSSNGKFDSSNPCINSIVFNIGGQKFPQSNINPLLQPSQAFRETQMAIGSFNNSQFQSCVPPSKYCKLSANSSITVGLQMGNTVDYNYNTGSNPSEQNQFIFGECLEVVAKRGLLSGYNCTSAPIFVEMNCAYAPTNAHTLYTIGMLDTIFVHDLITGDISSRV